MPSLQKIQKSIDKAINTLVETKTKKKTGFMVQIIITNRWYERVGGVFSCTTIAYHSKSLREGGKQFIRKCGKG